MALFGLSTKFWMMVLFRALGGGIGGSNTALRVMGSELAYTKEEESRIITHMSISFRLGQIVGQPVGGGLSHPEKRWPRLFGNPFWRSFPYALPCFVGAAYAVITVIVGQIVLKETLSSKGPKPDPTAGNLGNTDHTETTPLISENTRSTSDPMILQSTPSSPSILSALTWPLLSLLLSSAAMTLITEIFFAVYPLFAFTPVELGGLGLSEAEIGVHMSTRSILLVCGLFFFTKLEKRFGRLAVYRLSLVAWIPTIMLFPILNWIVRGHGGGKGGLIWYLAFFTLFTLWSITGWSWS